MVGFSGSEYEVRPQTAYKKGKTFKTQLEVFIDRRGGVCLVTVLLRPLDYSERALKMKTRGCSKDSKVTVHGKSMSRD